MQFATQCAAALIIGFAATSAVAAPVSTPPSSAPATSNSGFAPNQVVCVQIEQTGSHLPGGRVCHTRAEWAALSAQSEDDLSQMERQTYMPVRPGFGAGNPAVTGFGH